MTTVTFYDWMLECDIEATYEAYKKISAGSAEECGCIYCNNFITLRDEVFQGEILELLEKFGVNYKKAAETYEVTLEEGRHLYNLWYHSIGKIIKKGSPITFSNDLRVDFFEKTDLRFEIFENKNLIQIEIENVILPWVLTELPPR